MPSKAVARSRARGMKRRANGRFCKKSTQAKACKRRRGSKRRSSRRRARK